MADTFASALLEQVSIADVLTHFGIDRRGNRFTHQCHDFSGNTTHYATYYQGGNDFFCHRCRRFGGVVELVMDHADVPRHRAVEMLAEAFELVVDRQDLADEYVHTLHSCLTDAAMWYHARLMASPDILDWVHDQWGLTKETIEDAKVGLGYELPVDGFPHPTQVMMDAGILQPDATHSFARRLVIPTFRNGRVVFMTGRSLPGDNGPKYFNLKSNYLKPVVYGYDEAYRASNPNTIGGMRDVLLCEGQFDALAARQAGFVAMALGRKESGVEGLADVVRVAQRSQALFIMFDSEANQVGQNAAHRTGGQIVGLGYDPIIVDLPRRAEEPKVDLASYLKHNGGRREVVDEVLEEHRAFDFGLKMPMPTTYLNRRIATLTPSTNPKIIEGLLASIAKIPKTVWGMYLRFIEHKTGLKASQLQKSLTPKARVEDPVSMMFADDDDAGMLFYSQDYRVKNGKWTATKLVHVPMKQQSSDGENVTVRTVVQPYLVVTEMDDAGWRVLSHRALDTEDMDARDKHQVPAYMPERMSKNNWSVRADVSHSLPTFLRRDEDTEVNPWVLYHRMLELARRYIYMTNEADYHIVVTYCFLTYIYMGLPAIPYLFFYGEPGTGKSTTKEYMTHLAFQAIDLVNLREAQLYREAHARRPTFFLDEGEKLNKINNHDGSMELLSLFNAGYRNGGSQVARIKMSGEGDADVQYFDPYCPKVIQSTKTLTHTLASRCVQVNFRVKPQDAEIRSLGVDEAFILDDFQELRNQLFCWSMTSFHKYFRFFQQFQLDQFHNRLGAGLKTALSLRGGQLWCPILAFHYYLADTNVAHRSVVNLLIEDIPKRAFTSRRDAVSDMRAAVLEAIVDLYGPHLNQSTEEAQVALINERIYPANDGYHVDLGHVAMRITQSLIDKNVWRSYWELKRDDLHKMIDKIVEVPKTVVQKYPNGRTGPRYRCNVVDMDRLVVEIERILKVEQQEDTEQDEYTTIVG